MLQSQIKISYIYIHFLRYLREQKEWRSREKKVSSNLSLYQNTRSIRIKGRCSSTHHHHREIQFVFFTFILFRFLIKKNFNSLIFFVRILILFHVEKIFCLKHSSAQFYHVTIIWYSIILIEFSASTVRYLKKQLKMISHWNTSSATPWE